MFRMDALDREILSRLQEDGRLSITDLAAQIGLSLSACHRRVKDLEASGAIERYRAVIDPASIGLGFEAVVFVTIGRTDGDTIVAFEEAVAAIPEVVEAERLFGDPDYLIRILTADLAAYQRLYDSVVGGLPGVQRATSTLVMRRIGPTRTIPV